MIKKRKVPERKCIVTGEMKPKKELIRVVRNKDGEVFVDPTGKKNGRGAYLSKRLDVIEEAEKTGALKQQLQANVTTDVYEELKKFVGTENE